jgi:hypothetical protein
VDPIETMNNQGVAVMGDAVIIMRPITRMTVEEALRHAAWLIAITGDRERFEVIYEAVINT